LLIFNKNQPSNKNRKIYSSIVRS